MKRTVLQVLGMGSETEHLLNISLKPPAQEIVRKDYSLKFRCLQGDGRAVCGIAEQIWMS